MKKLLSLSLIVAFSFASCTKKINYCPPPVSDTVKINPFTFIGKWKSTISYYKDINLSFTDDSMSVYSSVLRYTITKDTIYKFRPEFYVIEPVFTYTVVSNDTVILKPCYDMVPTAKFYKY